MPTTTVTTIARNIRDFYSQEIIYQAQPKLFFAQFAKKRQDLTVNDGGSIKFTKYNNIARGGKLTDGVKMGTKSMSTSEIQINVHEYGNAVQVTELALQRSMHDELGEAAVQLANDMALVLDTEIRDVALTTTNVIYGNGKTSAGSLVANDGLTAQTVKDAVEALANNNAPKLDGQWYICIATPHQLRQLRDDDDWINAHNYGPQVSEIFRGEVGMYEGVRFVETTQMPKYTQAQASAKFGASVACWEAIIFGENAFAWAEALEVEMRDNGVEDFGRIHGLAWYSIWGFGLIQEENIFRILTA
jgi:N4-gp56 family major capsid protein